MILTDLTGVTAYRMLIPKWAVAPVSGEGAAQHGGRLNRPGIATLYLALDVTTAIKEYQQLSTLLPPGTLVSYHVNMKSVVDFRDGSDPSRWPPIWQDFFCDWRSLWFGEGVEPPSWVVGDEVIDSGAKGVLFSSQANPGGFNLALYIDALSATDRISVIDPDRSLPKNQNSWN